MNTKQRTVIVSGWLIFMLIVNSLSALLYLFKQDLVSSDFPNELPVYMFYILAILCVMNIVFITLIYKWKKNGVWGWIITSIIAVCINFYNGLGIGQSLLGLLGIGVLLLALQAKKNNVSNWKSLE
nr:hypothetical protein [uncultured Psychroserpens sp.]